MATYRVEVVRIGYRVAEIDVEANSIEEAESFALEQAGNTSFSSEHDYDYEVNMVEKVEKGVSSPWEMIDKKIWLRRVDGGKS